jgi:hypothetical protein
MSLDIRRLTSQLTSARFCCRMSVALQLCVRNIKWKFDPLLVASLQLPALQTTWPPSVASTHIHIYAYVEIYSKQFVQHRSQIISAASRPFGPIAASNILCLH